MKVAIDVTGKQTHIAWLGESGLQYKSIDDARPSATLLPVLKSCLDAAPISQLGVVIGPGSFTGIRTGIATALGLKSALGIPVLGFNKFVLMALLHQGENEVSHLLVPGRAPALFYGKVKDGVLVDSVQEIRVPSLLPDTRYVCTIPVDHPDVKVEAAHFAALAIQAMQMGMGDPDLTPLYVRPADTRLNPSLIEKLLAGD